VKANGKVCALILSVAILPFAAPADPVPEGPAVPAGPLTSARAGHERVSDVIGRAIIGREGQSVGALSDVVFDMSDGRVAFGVVTTLEDERKIAVPAALLKTKSGGSSLAMSCSQQHFRAASDFSQSDLRNPAWASESYAYFGLPQPGQQLAAGPVVVEAAGAKLSQFSAPPKGVETPISPAKTSALQFTRWCDLAGNAVKDRDGNVVGDVKDVVIDWPSGRMSFAILDATGVVGLSQQYIAIAPRALKPSPAGGSFVADITKNELAAAPSFMRGQWAAAETPDFAEQVNRFYSQPH